MRSVQSQQVPGWLRFTAALLRLSWRMAVWAWHCRALLAVLLGFFVSLSSARQAWGIGQYVSFAVWALILLACVAFFWSALTHTLTSVHLQVQKGRFFRALLQSEANRGQIRRRSQLEDFRQVSDDLYTWRLRASAGFPDAALEDLLPSAASDLDAHSIAVTDNHGSANNGIVSGTIAFADPLEKPLTDPAPLTLVTEPLDPHDWYVLGVNHDLSPFELPLFLSEQGGLRMGIAGRSGSGKGSLQNQIALAGLLSGFDCYFIDPKRTELAWAKPWAASYACERDEMSSLLSQLRDLVAERQRRVSAAGLNLWSVEKLGPPALVVVDEASALFTTAGGLSRKDVQANSDALIDLMARARSAGVSVVLTGQRLGVDTIPSDARSNMDLLASYAVNREQDSEVNLPGSSQGPDLYNPFHIGGTYTRDGALTTAGVFVTGGSLMTAKARSYYISIDQARETAERVLGTSPTATTVNTLLTDSVVPPEPN